MFSKDDLNHVSALKSPKIFGDVKLNKTKDDMNIMGKSLSMEVPKLYGK